MNILILATGLTQEKYISTGMNHYLKRLSNYKPAVEYRELKIPAKVYTYKDLRDIKKAEAGVQINQLLPSDYITLLDEKGITFSSVEFASYFSSKLASSYKRWVFLIGGPFGFDPELYNRAHDKIALSSMTFTHQMIRLLFLEQLYRAQTILHHQSYHH